MIDKKIDMSRCPICNHKVAGNYSADKDKDVLRKYQACRFCDCIKRFLFCLVFISTIILSAFAIYKRVSISVMINQLGLMATIWGGYLIATGYLEEIFIASALWGGELKLEWAKKNVPLGRLGTFLLIIGFIMMAISQYLN